MPIYKFIIHSNHQDSRSIYYMKEAKALGLCAFRQITVQDLSFIEGQLSQEDCRQLALQLLIDPVTQSASWIELPSPQTDPGPDAVIVEVALRPGVTDPVAEQMIRAAHELGFDKVMRAATGQRFLIEGADQQTVERLARRLLVNNVIQRWTLGEITPSFLREAESNGTVDVIPIRGLTDDELLASPRIAAPRLIWQK